jgi:peptidoglycan/LPS O-acetylase OafA/YrhL
VTSPAPGAGTTDGIEDRPRFRPEIEGVRAVAAILVAVYHVFIGRVSGGVDVFFVIAGFLITTTLLGHLRRSGSVAPGVYLARLASRLVPLAALVLVVVLVATLLWMPITRMGPMLYEIAASALYVENWALAVQQVDYLARGAGLSPVQHFWAMSIQGQFYAIWLLVFVIVGLVARRSGRAVLPLAAAILAVLFVGSLAFSIFLTERNQPLAYFHTGARVWEFAAGGLVALAAPFLATRLARLPPLLGIGAGWIGLAMIVTCGLVLPVSTAFPGWVALWPIVGALLVVLAGDAAGSASRWSATRLLGSRPLVYLGGVAYGIYLWHWPILVFYRARVDAQVAPGPGVVIIGASILLAIVTTRLVERPVRTIALPRVRPWRLVATAGAVLVVVALTAVGSWRLLLPGQAAAGNLDSASYPGAAAMDPGYVGPLPDVPFQPPPLAAQRDYPGVVRNRCNQGVVPPGGEEAWATLYVRTFESDRCRFGDPDSDTLVVMVGGSHVAQWFDAVEAIAEDRGWLLVSTTKSGCRFSGNDQGRSEEGRSCAAWNAAAIDELVKRRPDLVITTGTVTGSGGERIEDGFLEYARRLEAAGVPVAALRDNPRWPTAAVDCLALHPGDPGACTVSRSRSVLPVSPWASLPDPPDNVTLIDLNEWLCEGDVCPAVIGNLVTNYDAHHLASTFVRTLRPMLEERLPALGP